MYGGLPLWRTQACYFSTRPPRSIARATQCVATPPYYWPHSKAAIYLVKIVIPILTEFCYVR